MTIIDCEQGSEKWIKARLGRITASCMSDAMAKSRDGKAEGTTRKNYRMKLVLERLTGKPCDNGYSNKAMENGTEWEPFARTEYELRHGVLINQIGLALHPSIKNFAASPDGLLGSDGGIEIKCGFPRTHYDWLKAGTVPAEYAKQMLAGMACCERQWWDFVSYCADFPAPLKLFVVRMWRDNDRIAEIEEAAIKLDREIEAELKELEDRCNVGQY